MSCRPKADLYTYQVWLARIILKHKKVLLSVPMGLGKTGATLTAVMRLLSEGAIRKVLIVAPLYVAETTWPDEIKEWQHTKRLRYSVVTGSPKKRLAALRVKADVYIINRENVQWLWRTMKEEKIRFDMLVYDESRRLGAGKKRSVRKTSVDGQFKVKKPLSEFGSMAAMSYMFEYVVLLTGTPAPGGIIDLWGQVYIIDKGERLGEKRSHYLERYFDSDYMGYSYEPKDFAEDAVMKKLRDVMFSLRAEDHIKLPKTISNTIWVTLPKKVMDEYRRFERELVSEIYDVEAASRGVLINKLLQFANGSMYRNFEDGSDREIVRVHDEKMAALESVMSEANGEPVLIAYNFGFDRELILKKYPKAITVKTPNWKKLWDKRTGLPLLAHPASIGHGLNLQHGGHISCWFGLTWSLELFQQFNTRLPRPGQKSPYILQNYILAKNTADETVLKSLIENETTQDRITEAVRRRILRSSLEG